VLDDPDVHHIRLFALGDIQKTFHYLLQCGAMLMIQLAPWYVSLSTRLGRKGDAQRRKGLCEMDDVMFVLIHFPPQVGDTQELLVAFYRWCCYPGHYRH
jgi:hypothetical protein